MNVVLTPEGSSGLRGTDEQTALLPEGAAITNRPGRLEQQGIWWTLIETTEQGERAIKLLPNGTLDQMVRTHEAAKEPITFNVSGLVTVFGEENYLLARSAMRVAKEAEEFSTPAPPVEAPDGKLSAEDVRARLQDSSSTQTIITPLGAPRGHDANPDTLARAALLIPGGTPLMSRPGRLVRSGDWLTFYFESDHPDNPQPAMKMLPSQTLSLMMEAAPAHTPGLVFLVSGEVTEYRGENYLLARAAMRRIDSGNLSQIVARAHATPKVRIARMVSPKGPRPALLDEWFSNCTDMNVAATQQDRRLIRAGTR